MAKRKARLPAGPVRRSARHSTSTSTPAHPSSATAAPSSNIALKPHLATVTQTSATSLKAEHVGEVLVPPAQRAVSSSEAGTEHRKVEDVEVAGDPLRVTQETAVEVKQEEGVEVEQEEVVEVKEETIVEVKEEKMVEVKEEKTVEVEQGKAVTSTTVVVQSESRAGPSSTLSAVQDSKELVVKPAKRPRKKKTSVEGEEKRPARFRKKCPQNIQERVNRVMTQRMFMIDREKLPGVELAESFKVLGSTGNVYTVTISQQPRCDCPDCRKGNVPCKHIIFVFMKVLKVPAAAITWYQKGLSTSEVQEIFAAAPDTQTGPSAASTKVRNAYLRAIGAVPEEQAEEAEKQATGEGNKRVAAIGEDCPVCFEEMSEQDQASGQLVFDESLAGCGKPIHRECFRMWAAAAAKTSGNVTCVWCRSAWPVAEGASAKGKGKAGVEYTSGGYLNMADVAGMSRARDTSTYYWGPMAGRRMWEARYGDD